MNCLLEHRNKAALIVLTVFAAFSCAQAGSIFDTDIQIIKSDDSGITFKYIVPDPYFEDFEIGNENYKTLEIKRTAQIRAEGRILIPVKIVPLGVPPESRLSISVLESEYNDLPYVKLTPFFIGDSEEDYAGKFRSARAANFEIPESYPYILSKEIIRRMTVVSIALPTARYSAANRELSVLKSMTVRIDFIPSSSEIKSGYRNPGKVFNRILKNLLANYDQAGEWFLPETQRPLAAAAVTSSPFDSASTWIRVELSAEGIYRIGWLEISSLGINPLSIDPDAVRMFNGGGREIPVDNSISRPELNEIPITVLGGGDGQFDNGDYIVFYGYPTDGWQYSDFHGRFIHYRNHYTDKNVYWLALEGDFGGAPRRFASIDGSPDGTFDVSVNDFISRYQKEVEWIFWRTRPEAAIHDFFDWYWGYSRTFRPTVQLIDVIPGGDATIHVRHRSGLPYITVNNSEPLYTVAYVDSSSYRFSTYNSNDLTDGLNQLVVESSTDFYFDNIEAHYPRSLKAVDGNLHFSQPAYDGIIRYNLSGMSSPFILLDVSDPLDPSSIENSQLSGGNLIFHDYADSATRKEYYISTIDRLKSPGNVSLYDMDNLRDPTSPENQADIILIAYDSFVSQAERLKNLRLTEYGLTTRIVKVSDIFNQFGWGMADPVAIRDFLKYAYENWAEPSPTYATLLGDGHYDYRDNLSGVNQNFIPPYENNAVMSDEYFVYFGQFGFLDSDSNSIPDMVIGRIPAKSIQDAEEMINKFEEYDKNPDLAPWRNKVVVVADDNLHPPLSVTETYHTTQAESLTNGHVPERFEVAKIYLVEYPLRTGGEKPEAREAVIGAFNTGALIVDWIGHGSPGLWADERIFRRSQDLVRLTNSRRLPLIYTASCSIGFFDEPNFESFAEELLRTDIRGGVAVISATREVYAGANAQLNAAVFDYLLNQDSVGIGEALYTAKYLRYRPTTANDRSYILLGDPSQILQFPKFEVQFAAAPDSIVALSVGSVSGVITDNNGSPMNGFNGTAWVTVKDGSINRNVVLLDRNNNPLNASVNFKAPGPTIFIGPVNVTNGQFSSQFFIPKDVSYGNQEARIYVYAENAEFDAVGVVDSILVSGSIPAIQDSVGPQISLSVGDRPFNDGITMVPTSFNLTGIISDEHGVNITGQLGHGITVKIDDGEIFEADVTGNFIYNRGEYTGGEFNLEISDLPRGEHEISIKAWDNFNNSTFITRRIEAVESEDLTLSHVMNYPNPINSGNSTTTFQYCLSAPVDRVKISVFTEAGRKIKVFDLPSAQYIGMDCNYVDWDLRDADGDELSNGIYIYKVFAETRDGNGRKLTTEEVEKLVILR